MVGIARVTVMEQRSQIVNRSKCRKKIRNMLNDAVRKCNGLPTSEEIRIQKTQKAKLKRKKNSAEKQLAIKERQAEILAELKAKRQSK